MSNILTDGSFIMSWVLAMFIQFLPEVLLVLAGHISTTGKLGGCGSSP